MRRCKQCQNIYWGRGLKFCSNSCKMTYRNLRNNPAKTPEWKAKKAAHNKSINSQAKMMSPEARAKAIPKISAALKGRPNIKLRGKIVPEEMRKRISKTLRGRYCGPDNPNWRGGTSKRDWKSTRYKEFLRQVWANAEGYCQDCGTHNTLGIEMHAHHLQTWIDAPHLRYDPSNAILLCEECHYKTYKVHIHTPEEKKKISEFASARKRNSDGTFTKCRC